MRKMLPLIILKVSIVVAGDLFEKNWNEVKFIEKIQNFLETFYYSCTNLAVSIRFTIQCNVDCVFKSVDKRPQ